MTAFHQTSIRAKRAKMKSLALVVVFCAFVPLSDSACFTDLLKRGAKHCVDRFDHSKHRMGSTWRNDECVKCTCSPGRMHCCNVMGQVATMTEGCAVKYNYTTCTFDVFHPEDPSFKCDYGVVGK
ncbi:small serum protein 2-like [Labeo rohita]|uniref:small serum protein 2-like n=1 Tax=Labeo rohita TaxID=84645 RepID=UPI0021E2DC76|nr:small serum protein 2-like [Labeo rohita]